MKIAAGFIVPKEAADNYEQGKVSVIHASDPAAIRLIPVMITHAFNVNHAGEIHDTVLGPEGPDRYRYYGRVVPHEVASTMKTGEHLADWFGKHFQGINRGPNSLHTGQLQDIDHD
jgi:hypothetical protein